MGKRPLPVTLIACVYIAMGAIGFAYHVTDFGTGRPLPYDAVFIEVVRLVAIVCGAFMLRGQNWARWVALAWMAFHVVVSAFHSLPQFAMHCLFLAVIAWFLFRPNSTAYFRRSAGEIG